MAEERLQKVLARAGIASRRKAEELITKGRVRVDGQIVTELGTKVNPKRVRVEVDGRKIEPEQFCYGIFHKPRGMVTTLSDPEGRPTARDVLRQVGVRVVPVGRLDFNTSGALLFTNDGDFAQAIQHPKTAAPKVYAAKIQENVDEKKLERWSQSIDIEGKRTKPASVRFLRREPGKCWLEITISEGKNRQVRRLGEHAGTPVVRLARLSHAGISTDGLRPGHWRLLTIDELKTLKKAYGVPEKIRGVMQGPPATRQSGSKKVGGPKRTTGTKRASGAGKPSGDRHTGAARKTGASSRAGGTSKPDGSKRGSGPKKAGGSKRLERPGASGKRAPESAHRPKRQR